MLTKEILLTITPEATTSKLDLTTIVERISAAFEANEFNTVNRKAAFIAQAGHESGYFRAVSENLNYGAKGLLGTFPKYFDVSSAAAYERQPEKIANKVYASRMGNGDEASGDGWKYRGRGLIQLTGKNNYEACGKALGVNLIDNPDWATTPDGSVATAMWFWMKNKLHTFADADDIKGMTKKINGGFIGLEDRLAHYEKAKAVLAPLSTPAPAAAAPTAAS